MAFQISSVFWGELRYTARLSWSDNRWFIEALNRLYDDLVGQIDERKVRATQGRVPGNAWEARAYDKCNREQTASFGW